MPYAVLPNIKLYYEEYGSGEPVLFLHGFTLDRRMWEAQVPFLSKAYRVILLDQRGHGKSDAPVTGHSRADRVEDVLHFLDYLAIDRVHLVGLSMGGAVAIGFAMKYQECLKSLTLVSTGAAGYSAGRKFSKLDTIAKQQGVEAVMRAWMKMALSWYKGDKTEIKELMSTMMSEHTGAIWMDPMRGKYPRTVDLDNVHTISVPTCIFAGSADRIFVPLAEQLHAKITGSILRIYDGIGHMLNLEAPERFNEDLKRFLNGARV
jgi:pimeloyl-ACP methyl ester carboxylesterase